MITIEVRGLPAPQGSKRHVGHGIMVESSRAVGPWREAVRAETQRVMTAWTDGGLDGPLRVVADFYLPRPKGHYGTGKNAGKLRESAPPFPAWRPDLDKLARALLDGLGAGGAWVDDCQVVHLHASKWYADGVAPGCRITIIELEA